MEPKPAAFLTPVPYPPFALAVPIRACARNTSLPFFTAMGFAPVSDEVLEHPAFSRFEIGSLLFRLLLAAWTIYNEASCAAALVVAVVFNAAAIFVLAAVIDDES